MRSHYIKGSFTDLGIADIIIAFYASKVTDRWFRILPAAPQAGGQAMKTTAIFYLVKIKGQTALECSLCNELFFDRVSAGNRPRILASGIQPAIEHAKIKHQAALSRFTIRKGNEECLEAGTSPSNANADPASAQR